jgi:DNA-binding GntR family transcriptional regulator
MNRKLRKKKLPREERKCIKLELRNSERLNLKRRRLVKDRSIFLNKSYCNKSKKMSRSKLKFNKEKIF